MLDFGYWRKARIRQYGRQLVAALGQLILALLLLSATPLDARAEGPTLNLLGPDYYEVGGNEILIGGGSFADLVSVTFGGVPAASITPNGEYSLLVLPPAGLAPGPQYLEVTTAEGTSTLPFYYYIEPVFDTITPNQGPLSGGTTVTITGSGFVGGFGAANGVTFNGVPATFTVESDTQITAQTPPRASIGPVYVDIRVKVDATNSFTSRKNPGFTYAIRRPVLDAMTYTGPGQAGTAVTIEGSDMEAISQVEFGNDTASFARNSPTSVTAIAPAHNPGPVDVTMTSADGTSDVVPAGVFTYANPSVPVLDLIYPSSGPAGTIVTVTGTNLNTITAVNFDGVPASFTTISPTLLTTVAPAHGFGSAQIVLTSPDGVNTSTGDDTFFYMAGAATHFSIEVTPDPPRLLVATTVKITARDIAGNIATSFSGNVTLTTSDTRAHHLPQTAILTAGQGFSSGALEPTFLTPGLQSLTATSQANPAITGTLSFTMAPAPAFRFEIQGPPADTVPGSPFPVSIKAFDIVDNLATGYTGTIHFTSTDLAAVLPADATLVDGEGTFTATLNTPGAQTITATDPVKTTLTATTAAIQVTAPVLRVRMSHSGSAGTSEPTRYTIAPQSGDADTSGLLQLQLTLPAGTAATQFFSANWTCSTATLICTSVTPIPADTDSSEILVDVTMTGVTATSITPSVTLSGGGAIAPITATDPTDVVQVVMNSIPTLVVGLPARFTPLAGSGGSPPYFYAFYGLGLGYNTALGEFSGTPTQAGIFTVTGSVADRTLGSRKSSTDFLVTIINPPAITGLDIAAGRPAGGTSVVISGTDFDPVAANNTVSFGGSQATVTNASTTSLTVTTPAHAAGIVDVTVSVGPATSATSAASKFEYRDAPVLTFATPGSASVLFGGTLTNAATSTIAVPGAGAISYASSDPGVAAVDAAGAITTISAGTATITATQAAAAGINELATATYALTVTSPTLGLLSSASSGSTVGIAFSQLNSASGGQAPYVYTLASGVLPPGTGIDTSTGTVAGTPTAGGPFSYSVSVTDDLGASVANAVSGTIAAAAIVINTAALPDAHPGQAYGAISLPAPSGGTAPYSFADGGGLPAGISLSPLGVLSGTPSAAGSYSFTVSVADSSTGTGPYSAVQSFQIVVQPPAQQPPVATGDAYQINQDSVLTVAAPGLLGNDADADGDSLTAILVNDAADGALTLNADGSFVFVPGAGFSGSTSFTYKANDGAADSNVATVSIDVDAVAPMAGPAALNVPFGSADTPVSLTLSGPVTGVGIVTPPTRGTATISGLTISYRPNANFAGPDNFTYQAVNGVLTSAPATVTITVAPPASVVLPATVLPAAVAGTAYSATVDPASGGNGNFTYQVIGALPGWLSFDPALRQFNGVPPTAGAFDVVLRAVDGSTGLGPFIADQTYHLSVVGSQGSIAIAVSTDGTDGQFGFSSATLALNLVVATSGGLGQSPAVDLPAARYSIRAQDMRQAGLALTDIACTDPGVAVDVSLGQVDVDLRAGQSVVCTFQTTAARERTTALIDDFIANRANLIMTNQPDGQRRIDRLNGVLPGGGNPVSALMGYLPGIIESQPLAAAISLAAIDQMTGNQATNPLDIWMESTFALLDRSDSAAKSALVAIGADYLANPDLLIGGFVQGDFMTQSSRVDAGWIEGKGWLAGPYVTARLSDHLYLDLLAAAGRSSNEISPYGSYTDSFGATRWLASAALQGQWDYGDFIFSPAARLSYFEETSDAYIDSLGVPIPSVTSGTGQLAIGPGISWHLQTHSQVMVDTHVKFEGILAIANSAAGLQWQDLRGRIEAGIDLRLPGAANIGLTLGYDGIGTPDSTSKNAKVRLSAPL